MGYGIIDTSTLTNIADAIRGKLGVQTQYKPGQMPEAIASISGGGITPTGTKSITANGTYDVASYASAEVNVPSVTPTGTKQISITANGTTTEDVASYADAQISVNVPTGITPTGTKQVNITSNGTTTEDVTAYADAQITVNVPTGSTPTGTKNISITQNGTTTEDVANYANAQISVNVVNQDYEDALVAFGVTEDLTDSIEALTTYANGVTGESDTTLSDAVASLADGYGQGGGIANGIVVTSSDANGYPTSVEYYGQLFAYALGATRIDVDHYLGKIENVTFKDKITDIPAYAFFSCAYRGNGIESLTFPDVVSVGTSAFGGNSGNGAKIKVLSFPALETLGNVSACFVSKSIEELYLPKLTTLGQNNHSYGICRFCTGMKYAEIGSVGYTAPDNIKYQFRDCTQSTLTICIYTSGTHVDSILTTLRTYATSATIIFKASEATTYNGTSYAAGDTILTSTP